MMPYLYNHYKVLDRMKIEKVFNTLKSLSKTDEIFKDAIIEFENSNKEDRIKMADYLLEIFNDSQENNISIEAILILSLYY